MPYIGRTLGQGTRSRFLYTATAGQTTFSGSDSQSNTLAYADNNGLDCFQNGVLLKGGGADYTATTGTSVVLTTGASVNDVIEILVYDVFAIADHVKKSGDAMTGALTNIDVNGTELILDADGDTSITADTDDQIDIKVGGSDVVHVTSTGLGVGTTSVGAKLHVQSGDGSITPSVHADELLVEGSANSGITIGSGTSGLGSLRFADSGGDSQGSINYDHSDDSLKFFTDDSNRMTITSAGLTIPASMAINTTSTTVASRGSRFAINQDNASGFGIAIDNIRNDTASSGGILITNNETSGTFDALSFLNPSNQEIGKINTSNSGTTYSTSSDYRLKENVVTDWDATSRLKQLKPSRFNFKTDKDTTQDGFLAHEVQSIVPEAITGEKDKTVDFGTIKDKDGNVISENVFETETKKDDGQTWTKTKTENVYQGIDHSKLVPLLTKALQEAVAKIETLEAKVTALEGK